MTKEQKAIWVAALRSGDFKQGHGRLLFNDAYCCLGVASQVCNLEYAGAFFIPRSFLSIAIQSDLTMMNDGRLGVLDELPKARHTFPEIADYIDQHIHPEEPTL